MRERKKQVWLRPDQAELVVECLKFSRARCLENSGLTTAAEVLAKKYTARKIDEILVLFGEGVGK